MWTSGSRPLYSAVLPVLFDQFIERYDARLDDVVRAMVLALKHPAEVARIVVVDIAPVPNPPRHLGYVQAMQELDPSAFGASGLSRR